jgi:hypothetical protein
MGWWIIKQTGQELIQGDEPYDILMDALEQLAREYEEEWDRKPTLAELVCALETVLATGVDKYVLDGDEVEIAKLAVKTKKRRKNQSFRVGDFFAVPIDDELYAFGRILSGLRVDTLALLVGIYNKVSRRILTPFELKGTDFMFEPFHCDDEGWKAWKWKIIGNMPVESDEYTYPKYKEGFEGMGWWVVDPDAKREATEEEVRGLEYASMWPVDEVEERILKHIAEKRYEGDETS